MNGFWDAGNQRFQFGVHPEEKLWNVDEKLVTDSNGIADVSIRNAVQMDLSQWKTVYQLKAVDYLLERHNPGTLRILGGLRAFIWSDNLPRQMTGIIIQGHVHA